MVVASRLWLLALLPSLTLTRAPPCDALSTSIAARRPGLAPLLRAPHVGYVADETSGVEVFVIGTSHFRCASAREVTSLVEQVRPDGVVLELDPERALRLTKQRHGFDDAGARGERRPPDEILYGGDFVAAVDACQRLDIPLFLGDQYAQETRGRLARQLLNWQAYSPAPLMKSVVASMARDDDDRVRIDFLKTLARDKQKLVPLLVTTFPPLLLALALAFFDSGTGHGTATTNALETAASVVASLLASSLLFNTVIAERDEILAASVARASRVVRSLKDEVSIRKRWRFAVNPDRGPPAGGRTSDSLPLFTLKRPLERGAARRLNLFEPRWLKMIDGAMGSAPAPAVDAAAFGCVRCTNKFYGAVPVGGEEGRYADIIFERTGRRAEIEEVREGRRPVSGDRKLDVRVRGGDAFVVEEADVSASDDGYLVAARVAPAPEGDGAVPPSQGGSRTTVRMVVVVGLLHGNGVIDLLSESPILYSATNEPECPAI